MEQVMLIASSIECDPREAWMSTYDGGTFMHLFSSPPYEVQGPSEQTLI